MDQTNLHILQALQKNGRLSISDLARLVGRAESTVRERVLEMEAKGVLRGYAGRVHPASVGYHVQAYLKAEVSMQDLAGVTKRLEAVGNVTRLQLTTGPLPLRMEVWAESLQAMEETIKNRIAPTGLQNIQTIIVLRTLIEERPPPIMTRSAEAGPHAPMPSSESSPAALPLLLSGRRLRSRAGRVATC